MSCKFPGFQIHPSYVKDSNCVINSERNVPYAITVFGNVGIHFHIIGL